MGAEVLNEHFTPNSPISPSPKTMWWNCDSNWQMRY